MTVGEPEINLNTWGLRYVRKARKEEPSDLSAFGDTTPVLGDRSSDFKPSDYSSGGKGSPVKDSKTETLTQPRKDETEVSSHSPSRAAEADSGKKQTTGGTQETSTANPFGKERSLTSGGKLSTSGSPKHGKEAPQTKQPQHPLADNKRDSSGNPWKKVTQEGGTLPKNASAIDLAIIKCKLLKAKDVTATHGYGSSNRYGSENTGSANIVDASGKKETKAPIKDGKTETLAKPRPDEEKVTSYGEGATGTHGNDSRALKPTGEMRDVKEEGKGEGHGDKAPNTIINRSEDEIVIKAIELINEAYTEMNKKFSHGEAEAVKPSHRKDDEKDESDKND